MRCPGCGANVPAGKSICDACDYIIDASFLSAPPKALSAPPSGRAKPVAPRGTPARRPATPMPPKRTPPAMRAARPPRAEREETPLPEEELDWRVKYEPVTGPSVRSMKKEPHEELLESVGAFVSALHTPDKITLAGAVITILVSFFPWKITAAEGEVLGVASLGIVATLAAAGVIGTIALRVQRAFKRANPILPWLLQFALVCFSVIWCLVFIKVSWDGTKAPSIAGNLMVPISMPAMGVYLAVMSSILSLGGTLLGLRDSQD